MCDLHRVDEQTLKGIEYRKSMPFYEISLSPHFTLFYIMMDYLEKIITFGHVDETQMYIFKDHF